MQVCAVAVTVPDGDLKRVNNHFAINKLAVPNDPSAMAKTPQFTATRLGRLHSHSPGNGKAHQTTWRIVPISGILD